MGQTSDGAQLIAQGQCQNTAVRDVQWRAQSSRVFCCWCGYLEPLMAHATGAPHILRAEAFEQTKHGRSTSSAEY